MDFILTNKKHVIQDCAVINKFNTGSDHRLVRCKLRMNIKTERLKLFKNKKITINTVGLHKHKEQFHLELKNRFECLKDEMEGQQSVTESNRILIDTLNDAALQVAGKTELKPIKKISEKTKNLMKKRREFKIKNDDVNLSEIEYIENSVSWSENILQKMLEHLIVISLGKQLKIITVYGEIYVL